MTLGISINNVYKYESESGKQAVKLMIKNDDNYIDKRKPNEGEKPLLISVKKLLIIILFNLSIITLTKPLSELISKQMFILGSKLTNTASLKSNKSKSKSSGQKSILSSFFLNAVHGLIFKDIVKILFELSLQDLFELVV